MGVQNPLDSQLLAFSLLLLNTPARRHKLRCLFLSVLIFVRASALRLADLRALAPSALVAISYPESAILFRIVIQIHVIILYRHFTAFHHSRPFD